MVNLACCIGPDRDGPDCAADSDCCHGQLQHDDEQVQLGRTKMRLLTKGDRGAPLGRGFWGFWCGMAVLMGGAGPKLSQWMGLSRPAPYVLH